MSTEEKALGLKSWLAGPKREQNARQESEKLALLDVYRVAVLPFANIGGDVQDEYFADGMTDELISVLSNIGNITVISRTSAMTFKGAGKTVTQIGRELRAGTLLEGSVRKWQDKLRVTAKLIDANSDKHLWSQTYDRKLKDVFSLQSEIAGHVANSLRIKLVSGERDVIDKRQTANLEAYNLYLQGKYQFSKRTETSLNKGIKYFQKAIEKDPEYALGYSGIADSYLVLATRFLPTKEASSKAKQYALKALAINDQLAEAHTSLASALDRVWNWKGAEKEYLRAFELNSNYSTAHHWYALSLGILGRFKEAIEQIKRAEEADPLSLIIQTAHAVLLDNSGKYEAAIEKAKNIIEFDPSFLLAHTWLAEFYGHVKMYDRSVEELERALALDPNDVTVKGLLVHHQSKAGRITPSNVRETIEELIELSKTRHVPPLTLARLYEEIHDEVKMFDCIEKAFEAHDESVGRMRFYPEFQKYRNDPRYARLLQKMRLD